MKLYESHKRVHAARIIGLSPENDDGTSPLALDGGDTIDLEREDCERLLSMAQGWAQRHNVDTSDGVLSKGYLVRYEGGYVSWSPKDAFEKGYREVLSVDYPRLSLEQAQELVSTKTAPRVTKESIEDRIEQVRYIHDGTGTFAIIRMTNTFEAHGYAKPADPANFDPDVGERYAYEDAFKKLWQLEGYLLCERLEMGRRIAEDELS